MIQSIPVCDQNRGSIDTKKKMVKEEEDERSRCTDEHLSQRSRHRRLISYIRLGPCLVGCRISDRFRSSNSSAQFASR